MSNVAQEQARWRTYYRAVAGRPPRELLRQAAARFGQAGPDHRLAIDLGCGSGIETSELLRQGWRVLAIDNQPEAISQVLASASPEQQVRLETQLVSFTQVQLPPADLIWAGLSIPFCPPEHFARLWHEVVTALQPGGRFAGDFFGPRHVWAHNEQMTFFTAAQIKQLLAPLQIEQFDEEEGARPTVAQGLQHWHAFAVIARKP